jgi:hypothetical protein
LGIPSLLLEVGLNLPAQDHPAQQQYRREVAWGLPMPSLCTQALSHDVPDVQIWFEISDIDIWR